MNKEKIIKKYSGQVLGYKNYKDRSYNIDDFLDEAILMDLFDEIASCESSITKSGFSFLEEYYGIDLLTKMLKAHSKDYPYDYDMTIDEYLKAIKADADES